MADILNPTAWSETDASNISGTQPSWPENMPGANVNNAARAMQGGIKRLADQLCATRVTAGTSSAYTVAYTVAPESLYNGQRFCILAHTPCSSAPTLNINSTGAKTIRKLSTTGVADVSASDIAINTVLDLVYVSALNQFLWINPPPAAAASGGGGSVTAHTHPQSDITGLVADLAAKASVASVTAAVTTEVASAYSGAGPHTLISTDAGKMVTISHTTGVVVNVNSSVFATNSRVDIVQIGAGQVTFSGSATRSSSGSKTKLTGQYSGATLWFTSASSYILIGDIAA